MLFLEKMMLMEVSVLQENPSWLWCPSSWVSWRWRTEGWVCGQHSAHVVKSSETPPIRRRLWGPTVKLWTSAGLSLESVWFPPQCRSSEEFTLTAEGRLSRFRKKIPESSRKAVRPTGPRLWPPWSPPITNWEAELRGDVSRHVWN